MGSIVAVRRGMTQPGPRAPEQSPVPGQQPQAPDVAPVPPPEVPPGLPPEVTPDPPPVNPVPPQI